MKVTNMEYPSLYYIQSNDTFKTTKTVIKRKWFLKKYVRVEIEEKINYVVCKHGDKHYKTSNIPLENGGGGIGYTWKEITEDEFIELMKLRSA